MNKYFVQFYHQRISFYDHKISLLLCNGFSDVLDYCKQIGKMLWVQGQTFITIRHTNPKQIQAPVTKGILYVSCLYYIHFMYSYYWAVENPELEIYCGGPALYTMRYKELPKNLHLVYGSVEDFFNIPNFSNQWKIEFPKELVPEYIHKILFSYPLENACYHNQCIYCNWRVESSFLRRRNKINPDQLVNNCLIDSKKDKSVWISSPCISSKFIKQLIHLPNIYNYFTWFRADKHIVDLFEEVIPKLKINLSLSIGVETLSDTLLQFLKKNITLDNVIRIFDICKQNNVQVYSNLITDFPFLTKQMINEIESNINIFKKYDNVNWIINPLLVTCFSDLEKMVEITGQYDEYGPIITCMKHKLTKEQKEINDYITSLYKENFKNYLLDKNAKIDRNTRWFIESFY